MRYEVVIPFSDGGPNNKGDIIEVVLQNHRYLMQNKTGRFNFHVGVARFHTIRQSYLKEVR